MEKQNNQISIIPLGGVGDVTRNMYLYEYKNEILIVDCGLGFADETMLGVDLLLPDITYLLQTKRKVVGMLLTHGHEDHIGALPFMLPQLASNGEQFPIYGSPFTAELINGKLREFAIGQRVKTVHFDNPTVAIGSFKATFIKVTHSVPDTAHIFIETPVGNFYHGSDFKFDDTPYDGKKSDYESISLVSQKGVLCLLSDCLGAERKGKTGSEIGILQEFKKEMERAKGKVIVTTFSSHIARINQVIEAAQKSNRKVCFIGRSLLKAKDVAQRIGYLHLEKHMEVPLDQVDQYRDDQLVFIVAGSQGQEGSGMARIANGEHREVKLEPQDSVIISADPIPGNDLLLYGLIDSIARRGARAVYTAMNDNLHVSGHGSIEELKTLISYTKPKYFIPIGGNFRHMVAYRYLAEDMGYAQKQVLLLEDGQEAVFDNTDVSLGRSIPVKTVYVDEVSGEELESYVLRDRQKLSEGGIVIVLVEIEAQNGQIAERPDLIVRGFTGIDEKKLANRLYKELQSRLSEKKGRMTNFVYMRKQIEEMTEKMIFREFRRRPLILSLVIEV